MNQRFTPDINEQPNMHRYRLDLLNYDKSGPSGRALDWCCVVDTVFLYTGLRIITIFSKLLKIIVVFTHPQKTFKIYQKVQLL